MLLTPSSRALPCELHKLFFKLTWCVVQEKKPVEVLCQLRAKFRARTITFPVTLGRMNLAHYNKALEVCQRVCVEGHTLYITGAIVAIPIYLNGL